MQSRFFTESWRRSPTGRNFHVENIKSSTGRRGWHPVGSQHNFFTERWMKEQGETPIRRIRRWSLLWREAGDMAELNPYRKRANSLHGFGSRGKQGASSSARERLQGAERGRSPLW